MRRAAALVLLAALSGCATERVVPMPVSAVDPSAFESWTASGRMALAANGEGGSGSFTWEQRETRASLSLRGPLGAGAMQVDADGDALSVTDARGQHLDDAQTRALLQARLGADLPWADLRYWMLGLPAPGGGASVSDAVEAPLRVIEQAGWRIAYDAFRPAAGISLPARFTASRGDIRLKVMVDDWRVVQRGGQGP